MRALRCETGFCREANPPPSHGQTGSPLDPHVACRAAESFDPHGNAENDALNQRTQKKWANLEAAYALWFGYYSFCRVHSSLRVTPAMEAGLADRTWTIAELTA